jgi:hypothetical protein
MRAHLDTSTKFTRGQFEPGSPFATTTPVWKALGQRTSVGAGYRRTVTTPAASQKLAMVLVCGGYRIADGPAQSRGLSMFVDS